jgi:hypothetical protein
LTVIGAGFGRKGTLSLHRALETLGFTRCYHMQEVMLRRREYAALWLWRARGGLFDGRFTDREHAVDVFERRVREVRKHVPAALLLVFDARERWVPLCAFLGVTRACRAVPERERSPRSHLQVATSRTGCKAQYTCPSCRQPRGDPMTAEDRTSLAMRYAAAWSGQDPVRFGEFYAENGSLIVNGSASVGRAAIVETARSYMAAFPDMLIRLDALREEPDATVFHWTWTGTNTGPGGTGRAVHLSGLERWTLRADGLILKSDGRFDADEYQRQLNGASKPH